MARIAAASVLLAGVSLLGPSEPSYDPWAWLVWGREVGQLSLDTVAGPSWKPLPVVFTTLFAPLGDIAPALWVAVARAGGIFALLMAFRVAARLAGGDRLRRAVAGSVALVALALTPEWVRYLIHGNEAPLAVGLVLLGIDRHLDGRRRAAFLSGAAACLARPELFGFLLLYGAYLALRSWRDAGLVLATLAVTVAAWLLPAWWGSGDPMSALTTARSEPSWSLSLRPEPWRAALDVAQGQAWLVLELSALVAAALAAGGAARARPAAAAPGAAGRAGDPRGGSGAQRGALRGDDRGGVLGQRPLRAPGHRDGRGARRSRGRAARAARGPGGSGGRGARRARCCWPRPGPSWPRTRAWRAPRPATRSSAPSCTASSSGPWTASGRDYVALFGPATVNRSFQTHMAWELSMPIEDVWAARGRGITFVAPAQPVAGPVRIIPKARRRLTIARVGDWTVAERPPGSRHVYTWPVLGFSLRVAAQS